jgi:hypothetical protein
LQWHFRRKAVLRKTEGGYPMSAAESKEIIEVMGKVETWPKAMRVTLARRILETIESPDISPLVKLPRGPSAAEVAAMFKTDKSAPDDATVRQWIGEYRMEKYGN